MWILIKESDHLKRFVTRPCLQQSDRPEESLRAIISVKLMHVLYDYPIKKCLWIKWCINRYCNQEIEIELFLGCSCSSLVTTSFYYHDLFKIAKRKSNSHSETALYTSNRSYMCPLRPLNFFKLHENSDIRTWKSRNPVLQLFTSI